MDFKDSLAFMNSSLSDLAESLSGELSEKHPSDLSEVNFRKLREKFPTTSCQFEDNNHFFYMIQKGIYPYSYITSYNKLQQLGLPNKEAFYNDLSNKECSENDYNRVSEVWNALECRSFMDYHLAYLKSDCCMLANVWSNFSTVCLEQYGVDPCHYVTAPSLSGRDAFE